MVPEEDSKLACKLLMSIVITNVRLVRTAFGTVRRILLKRFKSQFARLSAF